MKKARKMLGRILILGIVGTIAGVSLCLLEAGRRVRFHHFERFPFWGEKLVLVSPHPSTKEPYLILLMFFPWWFRRFLKPHPLPLSTPDKKNFPYLGLIKDYFVFIDRSVKGAYKRGKALVRLSDAVKEGANAILFIEGTRTDNALEWIFSSTGKKMGIPWNKRVVGYLVKEAGAIPLPLWVETSWKCPTKWKITTKEMVPRRWKIPTNGKIVFTLQVIVDFLSLLVTTTDIYVGWPLKSFDEKETEEEITEKTIKAMFELADEKG